MKEVYNKEENYTYDKEISFLENFKKAGIESYMINERCDDIEEFYENCGDTMDGYLTGIIHGYTRYLSCENNINYDYENVYFEEISKIDDKEYIGFLIGGDWEMEIYSIIYEHDNNLWVYTPKSGNVYNTISNTSFGNGREHFFDSRSFGNCPSTIKERDEMFEKYGHLYYNDLHTFINNFDYDDAWAYDKKGINWDEYSKEYISYGDVSNFDMEEIKKDISNHFKSLK